MLVSFAPGETDSQLGHLFQRCLAQPDSEPCSREFFERSRPMFARIARRVARQFGGCTPADIDDQVQEVSLRLSAQVRTIARRMPREPEAAQAYLAVLAANVCRDAWKARMALKRHGVRTPLWEIDGSSEELRRTDYQLLLDQIAASLSSPRHRLVFRLYFQFGFTAAEIAPQLGLGVKGVESLLGRVAMEARRYVQGTSSHYRYYRQDCA